MADEERLAAEAAREDQERSAKRRSRWGCLVWIGLVVILPILILGSVAALLVAADRQAAEQALQRARDAGDPVTSEEMRAFYGTTEETEAATARWTQVIAAVRLVNEDPDSLKMPLLGNQDAQATLDGRGLYDEATLARVEPFLAGRANDALAKAHAARDSAKDARFPIDFDSGFDDRVPWIQELRSLANLLALETQVHASRGDMTKATESLLTLIAVSETLTETPDLVPYLVRLAIFGVAVDLAMELVDRADFPPEDLQRLQQAFARQDFHAGMLRGVRGDQLRGLMHFAASSPVARGQNDHFRRFPLRGEDQAMMLSLHREFLGGAADGFPAADRVAAEVESRVAALESPLEEFRYAVTLDVPLAYSALVNAGIRVQAEARVAEACCACERYRQQNGEWPPSLEALVPEYLDEVPLDPVDDQPLRYEVDGEQAVIHSIAHFRPENIPEMRTFEDGFASQVVGEPYVPPPPPAPESADDPFAIE